MSHPLEYLAARVTDDPFFLAYALKLFAAGEGLDDAALAARLGCTPETLTDLRLCRMPREDAPHFRDDILTIAASFPVDAAVLAEVVRHAQVVAPLRKPAAATGPEVLLAARDAETPEGEP